MQKTITYKICAICKSKLKQYDAEGLSLNIGWSNGGWGRRKNGIEISDEVCKACFNCLVPHLREVETIFKKLSENNAEDSDLRGITTSREVALEENIKRLNDKHSRVMKLFNEDMEELLNLLEKPKETTKQVEAINHVKNILSYKIKPNP